MFEVQVLIPIVDNAGRTFTAFEHAEFEAFVIERFGGITRYSSEASGAWFDEGSLHRDRSYLYGIAVPSITDGARVGDTVQFAKVHYRQLAIFIRYLGIVEIL